MYNTTMTQEETISHWRREAMGSLTMAKAGLKEKEFSMSLFHCHLAIEKALKAEYISMFDKDHPYTHDLLELALMIKEEWTEMDKSMFSELTDYAIAARYSDPEWAKEFSTEDNASQWINKTEEFLSSFMQ